MANAILKVVMFLSGLMAYDQLYNRLSSNRDIFNEIANPEKLGDIGWNFKLANKYPNEEDRVDAVFSWSKMSKKEKIKFHEQSMYEFYDYLIGVSKATTPIEMPAGFFRRDLHAYIQQVTLVLQKYSQRETNDILDKSLKETKRKTANEVFISE
tara:strand:+ start:320 stop:781 length:462 start_codon:yes stop_codon:yes gene_type:complete